MHLRVRRRSERLRVELGEGLLDGDRQLTCDRRPDLVAGQGTGGGVEASELGERIGREQVGPGREQLPGLDEHPACVLEGAAGTPRELRGAAGIDVAAPQPQGGSQSVPRGDPCHLGHAADDPQPPGHGSPRPDRPQLATLRWA